MTLRGSRELVLTHLQTGNYTDIVDQEKTTSEPLFLSSSNNVSAAPFARICQATNLLTLVMRHINDKGCGSNCLVEESKQLIIAIQSLSTFLRTETSKEKSRICVAMAVCFK
jgi:hypothetical protein